MTKEIKTDAAAAETLDQVRHISGRRFDAGLPDRRQAVCLGFVKANIPSRRSFESGRVILSADRRRLGP